MSGPKGGAPRKDASLVADGLELVRGGLTPEEAAERLTAAGRPISGRTLRRAMTAAPAPASRAPATPVPPATIAPPALSPPEPLDAPAGGVALSPARLGELQGLISRLPFAQQDALVSTLPIERLRAQAIARGIAPYHDAAAAVARELRAVKL